MHTATLLEAGLEAGSGLGLDAGLEAGAPPRSGRSDGIPFFPYPQVFLREQNELEAIFRDVGKRGAFILQQDLSRFEQNLARFTGARHALGVANATDGLLIALRSVLRPVRAAAQMPRAGAAEEPTGVEVIFSAHTMVATAAAIHFAGAVPVPVECGADHLICPAAVEAAITPRTAAIVPTQLNGRTADMEALTRIAQRHHLVIVEDAAQALGSRFRGQCAGTFGAAGVVSFFPAKLLGCLGDGGAVLTNDAGVAARAWALHDHGRDQAGEITGWGLNSRLDNLQAAILDFRLARYPQAIEKRRALAGAYQQRLEGLAGIVLPPAPDSDQDHFDVYQNYEIEAERRDALRTFLEGRGIGTLLPWGGRAVHQFTALGLGAALPRTERLMERALLLPMHPWLEEEEVEVVASAIHSFYGSRS